MKNSPVKVSVIILTLCLAYCWRLVAVNLLFQGAPGTTEASSAQALTTQTVTTQAAATAIQATQGAVPATTAPTVAQVNPTATAPSASPTSLPRTFTPQPSPTLAPPTATAKPANLPPHYIETLGTRLYSGGDIQIDLWWLLWSYGV